MFFHGRELLGLKVDAYAQAIDARTRVDVAVDTTGYRHFGVEAAVFRQHEDVLHACGHADGQPLLGHVTERVAQVDVVHAEERRILEEELNHQITTKNKMQMHRFM